MTDPGTCDDLANGAFAGTQMPVRWPGDPWRLGATMTITDCK